ncbi:MAG: hypothetical protein KJZ96_12225 [Rhodocyclaceae bacterium]|nr:hypothetical protein [Rhodocyclaceae bacterium]
MNGDRSASAAAGADPDGADARAVATAWSQLRREGPAALEWLREGGLADARARALGLVWAGSIPFAGYLWLGWTPLLMIAWLLIDCVNTLIADVLRLALAPRAIDRAHRRDQQCTRVLGLSSELARAVPRPAIVNQQRTAPQLLFFFGLMATLFMLAFAVPGAPNLGIGQWSELFADPVLPWLVGLDLLRQAGGALLAGLQARAAERQAGRVRPVRIFVESGSNAVLYAGLLVLIWLPANYGLTGALIMLALLNGLRLAFGLYAWGFFPRALRTLQLQLEGAGEPPSNPARTKGPP